MIVITYLYERKQLMVYTRSSLPFRDVSVIVVSYTNGVTDDICTIIGICSLADLTSKYVHIDI